MTNAPRFATHTPSLHPAATTAATPRVDRNRVREFGVGYGNSSGYATARRYASNWGAPRFRCA